MINLKKHIEKVHSFRSCQDYTWQYLIGSFFFWIDLLEGGIEARS